MNNSTKAIIFESLGVLVFLFLCNAPWAVPTSLLVAFLVLLQAGLVWMAITILKDTAAEKSKERV